MKTDRTKKPIAYFISPHGFGHAARASAVMSAVFEADPSACFEIFTTVPSWFFEDSINGSYRYHPLETDLGLVQASPLHSDLLKTVERLSRFIPFKESQISGLARTMDQLNCQLVICDIAPMGIAVAREAGLRSVLVENFTWDWVYREYEGTHGGLRPHATYLGKLFREADYHVQAQPVCSPGSADLTVLPVSRRARRSKKEVRQSLGIPDNTKMVLVTMGGVPDDYRGLKGLSLPENLFVVIPGAGRFVEKAQNLITLPHRSDFFHPDLVMAADAVIGKVGYSTLAEVYHAGVPFGYIKRPNFKESDILAAFIERHMSGVPIDEQGFRTGEWISRVPRLLKMPRIRRGCPNGAAQVAQFVVNLLRGNAGSGAPIPKGPVNNRISS